MTWVGAITAIFAASIAVAQNDIKRILAYSTVSQLGYMMMGLGVGGVAVGMFHLITHAFFKALLFLGAGSVIHGCHEEQDIRHMGGLRKFMPVTFATYAVGMLALVRLSAVLLRVLEQGRNPARRAWLADLAGAVLSGRWRRAAHGFLHDAAGVLRVLRELPFASRRSDGSEQRTLEHAGLPARHPHSDYPRSARKPGRHDHSAGRPGGVCGSAGFHRHTGMAVVSRISQRRSSRRSDFSASRSGILPMMLSSIVIVFAGLGLGWWFYGRKPIKTPTSRTHWKCCARTFFSCCKTSITSMNSTKHTVIAFNAWWSRACDLARFLGSGTAPCNWSRMLVIGLSWVDRFCDEYVVNLGFDEGCEGVEVRRQNSVAAAEWPRAKLSARHRHRAGGAGVLLDLGVPRLMNGFPSSPS